MENVWVTVSEPNIKISTNNKITMIKDYCCADGEGHCVTIIDGYTSGQRWIKRCIKCGITVD